MAIAGAPREAGVVRVIEVPAMSPVPGGAEAGVAWIDGAFVPAFEARISVFDLGLGHCDATYDVAHVWNGRFFRLDAHVDRFLTSVQGCHLTLPVDRAGLVALLHECVARSRLREAFVDMIVTRGQPPPGIRDLRECIHHNLILYAVPYVWVLPREKVETGVHVIVSDIPRIPKECVNPRFKNFHWGDFNQALFQAYARGGDTTVLPNHAGHITEGPGFNVFMVRGGQVRTPPGHVLAGITRGVVHELCGELGLEIRDEYFTPDELRAADEVFISSTAGGIYPVVKIDGREIGDGRPGVATVEIGNLYWRKKSAGWCGTAVDYGEG